MSFSRWLRNLRSAITPNRKARTRRPPSLRAATHRPRLEVLEDRCLLSFSSAVSYPADGAPQAVVTADFNNDTVLDLAVANSGGSTVSVLLGNAGGTFQPASNSATGFLTRSLAVGDFNEDGKLDLATANEGDVSVLLGNGDGTFQAPTNINIGSSPSSLAVGDFNADGNLDLGVASSVYFPPQPGDPYYGGGSDAYYQSHANVLLGTGSGTLSFTSSTPVGGNYAYVSNYQQPTSTAAVADFNADGRDDFVSTSSNTPYASVLLANGNGTLSYATGLAVGFHSLAVVAEDVSGDGKADVVAANSDGAAVLLGNGLGSFGTAQNYALGTQPHSIAVADFNGDGTIDLVTGNGITRTVSVLLGTGAGAFKPPLHSPAGSYPVGVAVGDFNGDGRSDVAMADLGNNASVLFNDGNWLPLNAPSITINDVTVSEGNTGTVSATFTVSLSAGYGQPVSIHYATADGSATEGGDYQATSDTLTFTPGGPLTRTITVQVNGDRNPESVESFSLRLTNPTNAFVIDAAGVGTITDDEPSVSIIDYASQPEGNTGTTAFTFIVTLSAAYDAPVSVDYTTADLTPDEQYWLGAGATGGVDYIATLGTVTFNPGEPLTRTITVLVNGDRAGESDELFFVNLSNPTNAYLTSTQALGTITDDEPYVSISGGSVVEGNSGTKTVTFTVTLSVASDVPVSVTYATADGSATVSGGDYQAGTDTVTFGVGETSKTFTVLVNGDRLGEYDESFAVTLTGATGATISGGTAYGTIVDNEPRLSITGGSVKEGNHGTKVMTFTVKLSAAYDQAVTVKYKTNDWTATAGQDYVTTFGTLTFAPGQTTKTFTVTFKGDKKKESDERFFVSMSNVSGNASISYYEAAGYILNDDGRKCKC